MSTIEINNTGNVNVSGELSFNTVPELDKRGCIFIKNSSDPVFDLGKVTTSDNAGVALLVSWTRCAKNASKKVSFINLPKQLSALIEAGGLEKILRYSLDN